MESTAPPPLTTHAAPSGNANDVATTSPTDESAKRKRQPRNSACQPCATLKMKCVPSAVAGKCERCNRMSRECIVAIPKPRKRRTESNVGLESPAAFSTPGVPTTNGKSYMGLSIDPPPPPNRAPTGTFAAVRNQSQDSLLSPPDLRNNGSKSFTALLVKGLRLDSPGIIPGDLLHGLDYNTLQNSLTIFRQLSNHFPFVHVNPTEDPALVAAQRPFTTLAICAVASGANRGMQARLCYAVRFALSTKAIIEGEQGMDLLVGLLIFLAWHHHYTENHQIYQYLCLLAGMVEDLGLGAPSAVASIEKDRAFLGSYYLCAQLSHKALGSRNTLPWTDGLRRCADNIARAGTSPSDSTLLALVELAISLDDFTKEVKPEGLRSPAYTASVEAHASMASNRLKSLKHQYPALSTNSLLAAAMMDIHEKRLAIATNNTSVMIRCACDISEYVDDVLNRPAILMHQMVIVDWVNLLHILMLMVKVSKALSGSGTAGWEAGAVSSMLSPETILDRLSTHISRAPGNDPLVPRNENLIRWFQSFCDGIKRNLIHAQRSQPPDARFNSVNSLPYASPPAAQPFDQMVAVMNREFLSGFMDQP